jgi:hypothetical protein
VRPEAARAGVPHTTARGWVRRFGVHAPELGVAFAALAAEPKAYGRYEAGRPNERWVIDVLAGPWVPWPRREG